MSTVSETATRGEIPSPVDYSLVRRWWKHVFLCTVLAIAKRYADRYDLSMFLRDDEKYTNVALRSPESLPDANEWATLTRKEMMENYLKCDWQKERPIHDSATWIGMREAYISIVGTVWATVELDAYRRFETAFKVPFESRQSPGKGRGLFALKEIPKGTRLYDFSQSAQFRTKSEFVEFLRILQPHLACDILIWSYVQDFGENDKESLRIVADLDPGSYCNDGSFQKGNMGWLGPFGNIAWGFKEDYPSYAKLIRRNGTVRQDAFKSAPLVATKKIRKGDELLCMYGQFSKGLEKMVP